MGRMTVSSTEFRNKAGKYLDEAAREPVFITKHDRVTRVLIDEAEYQRLCALADTRRNIKPGELPPSLKESLKDGYQG